MKFRHLIMTPALFAWFVTSALAGPPPVRNAAEEFLSTLPSVQLARSVFNADDVQWRKWMNRHFCVRRASAFRK